MPRRLMIGLGLLVAVAIVVVALQLSGGGDEGGDGEAADAKEIVEIRGYIGGEKEGFMQNPAVQKILRDKYGIVVNFRRQGSIQMLSLPDTDEQDFLWPSNEVALELYRQTNPSVKFETIFNSPIVLYSWKEVVDALMQTTTLLPTDGDDNYDVTFVIEREAERPNQPGVKYTFLTADAAQLVSEIILNERDWAELGVDELFGKSAIISSDPTKSNSGNMFYGLLANMLVSEQGGGQVATDESLLQVLETIGDYYKGLGYLQPGSGDMFDAFVELGIGSYPLIVGYESQLIEFSLQNETQRSRILDRIKVIYPIPTVWSSHPLIALTPNGEKLLVALQDPEIQRIGWEEHGFRSGLPGVENNPDVFELSGIPDEITAVLPLPRPSVMETMINYLETGQLPTPTPTPRSR